MKLPEYHEAEDAVAGGRATALEEFIFRFTPNVGAVEEEFRDWLLSAIREANRNSIEVAAINHLMQERDKLLELKSEPPSPLRGTPQNENDHD